MKTKKLFRGSYRYPLILLVFLLPLLRAVPWGKELSGLFPYYALVFGGLRVGEDTNIFSILLSIVPNLLILYLFSNIMREDCEINYVYVFTRLGRKSKWLFQKTLLIFFQVFFTFLLLFLLAFVVGSLSGLRPQPLTAESLQAYPALFLCNAGTMFVLVLLQNVLSLRHGSTQAFLITLLLYIGSVIVAVVLYNTSNFGNAVLFFLPASNQMYLWHMDSAALPQMKDLFENQLKGYRLGYSYVILCAYALITYIIAQKLFQKRDLAEMMKEA